MRSGTGIAVVRRRRRAGAVDHDVEAGDVAVGVVAIDPRDRVGAVNVVVRRHLLEPMEAVVHEVLHKRPAATDLGEGNVGALGEVAGDVPLECEMLDGVTAIARVDEMRRLPPIFRGLFPTLSPMFLLRNPIPAFIVAAQYERFWRKWGA